MVCLFSNYNMVYVECSNENALSVSVIAVVEYSLDQVFTGVWHTGKALTLIRSMIKYTSL